MRKKTARLSYAQSYHFLTHLSWCHEIFTDESWYALIPIDGEIQARRLAGERLNGDFIAETVAHGHGSVRVWAAFHVGEIANL